MAMMSLTNYSQAYQTEIGDGTFIFVQTIVRNSDDQIVVYLESSKFTYLNLERLGTFLDSEASPDDSIVTIDEKDYQVIRRVHRQMLLNEDLVASTKLSDTLDGNPILLARFAHDGYNVIPGDTLESIWTFIRPVF